MRGYEIKEVHGSKMMITPDEAGLSELLRIGEREHEGPVAAKMKEILSPGMVIADIGANIGFYALLEAKMGAKVYAIEPLMDCFIILCRNITMNGYDNIMVFNMAIGDENKTERFTVSKAANWSGFIDLDKLVGDARILKDYFKGYIDVQVMTLDSFLKSKDLPDMLRMDVEGYEGKVLLGATETLEKMKPGSKLMIEFHPKCYAEAEKSTEDTLRFLEVRGFNLEWMWQAEIVDGRIVSNFVNWHGLLVKR